MALMVNFKAMFGLAIVLSSVILCCNGSVYKVGDSGGWTTMGNVDYKLWSATKSFGVGDIIRFEYNPEFHNVMRVTHAMYKACNASVPMKSYTSGNDSIAITSHGHHFFICGVPGHCRAGQKVDINVPRLKANAAPTPSSSIFVSPPVPVVTPSPTPNSAVIVHHGPRVAVLLVALVIVLFWGPNWYVFV